MLSRNNIYVSFENCGARAANKIDDGVIIDLLDNVSLYRELTPPRQICALSNGADGNAYIGVHHVGMWKVSLLSCVWQYFN